MAEKSDVKNAREIVQQVMEAVSQWNVYASEAEVKPEHITQIQQTFRRL
jgi:hypothetical protein